MVESFVIFLPSKNSNRANISNVTNECGNECKKSLDVPTKIVGVVSAHGTAQVRNGDARQGSLFCSQTLASLFARQSRRPQKAEASKSRGLKRPRQRLQKTYEEQPC